MNKDKSTSQQSNTQKHHVIQSQVEKKPNENNIRRKKEKK